MGAGNRLSLESVDCLICGSPAFVEEACGKDYIYNCCEETFHIVKCTRCGHLFLQPRPTPASVSIIYPQNYASFTKRFSTAGSRIARTKSFVMSQRMKLLKEKIKSHCTVIDIGCGDGQFLMDLRKMNREINLVGLDWKFSEEVKKDLEQCEIEMIVGRLEDVNLLEESFDLVTMNQLIEHLWDPRPSIKKIFKAMKKGGLLSIETINIDGYDRRWFKEGFWGGYYMPRHMNLFSHQTLKTFLENEGFIVERHFNLCAPIVWIHSLRAWTMSKSKPISMISNVFSDTNIFALALFATFDTLAKGMGGTTSNQKIIARKM